MPNLDELISLPELFEPLAQYLERPSIVSCIRVSKRWHRSFFPVLWRTIGRQLPEDFSKHGHLVQKLDLSIDSWSSSQYLSISKYCTHLRDLRLDFFTEPTPDGVSHFFRPEPENGFVGNHTKTLEIKFCKTFPLGLVVPWISYVKSTGYLQNLQHFRIGSGQSSSPGQHVRMKDMIEFLHLFPSLKTLRLQDVPLIELSLGSPQGFETEEAEISNLEELEFIPHDYQALSRVLQRTPHLRRLCIQMLYDPEILPLIQRLCSELETFQFRDIWKTEDRRMGGRRMEGPEPDWSLFLSAYPGMQALLFSNTIVSDQTAYTIATTCRNLKSLKVYRGTKISTDGLLKILKSCPSLQILHCMTNSYTGDLFSETNPWVCYESLEELKVFNVFLKEPEENIAFRTRIRELKRLELLSISGKGFKIESLVSKEDVSMVQSQLHETSTAASAPPETTPMLTTEATQWRLGVIVMPSLEDGPITMLQLRTILTTMPRVQSINFNSAYSRDAMIWLQQYRPYLEIGFLW